MPPALFFNPAQRVRRGTQRRRSSIESDSWDTKLETAVAAGYVGRVK